MQILRYAEEPAFIEAPGSPKTLAWGIGEEDMLRDAVASAYLGRPVAWHSLFSEGRDSRLHTRAGQNLADVWQAHADLAEEVRIYTVTLPVPQPLHMHHVLCISVCDWAIPASCGPANKLCFLARVRA